MKILIVEDNSTMRHLIRSILSDVAEVFECEDGAEALPLYERHQPDWVLMDIRMQHLNGIEATRQIITAHQEARVVIVTTHNDKSLRAAAQAVGACGFVLKEDLSVLRQMFATSP
jgi:two-component system response regulator DegU